MFQLRVIRFGALITLILSKTKKLMQPFTDNNRRVTTHLRARVTCQTVTKIRRPKQTLGCSTLFDNILLQLLLVRRTSLFECFLFDLINTLAGAPPSTLSSGPYDLSIPMPFPTTDTEHLHASNLFASRTFIDTTAALTGLDDTPSPASSFGGPLEPQPTIDISGFLSALDSSPWRATAGALYINNTGVHLHGSTAPTVRTSLPTHVSPSLARTHPFIPLLPLELAELLLASVVNLTLVDPGLMLTPTQPSSSFCARAFAGLALLSLVKVTEPVIDGNPIGTYITAQTLL